MSIRIARLRKTLGPLSGGTLLEVLGEVGEHGYLTARLRTISKPLRDQLKPHPVYHQLLGAFDLAFDEVVFARPHTVEASRHDFIEGVSNA